MLNKKNKSPQKSPEEKKEEMTENEKFMHDFWQQRHNGPVTKDKGDEVDEEKSIEM